MQDLVLRNTERLEGFPSNTLFIRPDVKGHSAVWRPSEGSTSVNVMLERRTGYWLKMADKAMAGGSQ